MNVTENKEDRFMPNFRSRLDQAVLLNASPTLELQDSSVMRLIGAEMSGERRLLQIKR